MIRLRTRFAKDIVAEFLPPRRASRKVVLLLSGFPSTPGKGGVLKFLSDRGYWAFHPRYRGTWESGGHFLARSPEEDVRDVIAGLSRGFKDAYNGEHYRVQPTELYLVGSSFGGAAALLASRDPRVTKAIAFSPVVDWTASSKTERFDFMELYVREGFGEAFRFRHADWKKLQRGRFYNPAAVAGSIDGRKILIVHAKDDAVVRWQPVARFAKTTSATLRLHKRGGHLSLSSIVQPAFYNQFIKFIHHV